MAVAEPKLHSEPKVWNFFKLPFRNSNTSSTNTTSSSVNNNLHHHHHHNPNSNTPLEGSTSHTSNSVSSVARSLLPTRRRLKLDPSNKLYFPYEPGKQVRSAIRIKNTSKSNVAFKFQTTAPKSCFMRPPGAILAPGESIIATVFKFVEQPENNEKPEKSGLKFKIMSLKVKGSIDYVPELFDEQKDQVAVEQILRVVFLDPERPSPILEKLKRQLADADAALEERKKPAEDAGPKIIGEGLVIDEWKERRERYLAKQQGDVVVDSV
ncbi:putative vesicle-associated membrane-protein-associated protein [Medicago truncatula]|uniref:Major sperm protein n=1 Tax=Medicago truncatula TaxID=3880 RepID=Q2HTV7_MEDTR|nr:vesicle-associated protein 4-2 [Medicago truncatula]ABD32337.1 Major sperm protein [Medicago truncatula]AES90463.1 structural molecule protein [Medicago truncatula]RHN62533.1 putative vesicle-associated membrane-protein-associated protein [Medicago truncatula]